MSLSRCLRRRGLPAINSYHLRQFSSTTNPTHHEDHQRNHESLPPSNYLNSWEAPRNPTEAESNLALRLRECGDKVKAFRKEHIPEMEFQKLEKLKKDEARRETLRIANEQRKAAKAAEKKAKAKEREIAEEEFQKIQIKEIAEKLEYLRTRTKQTEEEEKAKAKEREIAEEEFRETQFSSTTNPTHHKDHQRNHEFLPPSNYLNSWEAPRNPTEAESNFRLRVREFFDKAKASRTEPIPEMEFQKLEKLKKAKATEREIPEEGFQKIQFSSTTNPTHHKDQQRNHEFLPPSNYLNSWEAPRNPTEAESNFRLRVREFFDKAKASRTEHIPEMEFQKLEKLKKAKAKEREIPEEEFQKILIKEMAEKLEYLRTRTKQIEEEEKAKAKEREIAEEEFRETQFSSTTNPTHHKDHQRNHEFLPPSNYLNSWEAPRNPTEAESNFRLRLRESLDKEKASRTEHIPEMEFQKLEKLKKAKAKEREIPEEEFQKIQIKEMAEKLEYLRTRTKQIEEKKKNEFLHRQSSERTDESMLEKKDNGLHD